MRLTIPNPHHGDIDWSLMKSILRNAEIFPDDRSVHRMILPKLVARKFLKIFVAHLISFDTFPRSS